MTKNSKIRVLIVDDHAVLRSGLHLLLDAQSDIEVVGEAGDVKEAVFETRAKQPDVVLMDVVMPGQTGIEGVPLVLKEAPEAKVELLLPSRETEIDGSLLNNSITVEAPDLAMSARLTTSIGVGPSISTREILEPVTTTRWILSLATSVCCACA